MTRDEPMTRIVWLTRTDGTRTEPEPLEIPHDLRRVTVIHHAGRYYLNEGSNFYGPDHGLYRQTDHFRQCLFYDADQDTIDG